ncbi:fumarylacetoacetate hydrolase family protein [Hyphomonas sp.]|uniref:fumarylacetoacetate hydrolase family protein n=1 Tax=Hyphomonas sp. TaxID=87 RepID=UPI0035694F55
MRLVRFEYEGVTRFGALRAASVVPLVGDTMEAALKADASGDPVPLNDVTLLAPVVKPGKILGIGVNYAAHAAESVSFIDTKKPEVQKWFNKQVTAVNGPYADVHLPKVSEQLDYEGELVVIIGKHGRHVPRERAFEIVAGVTIGCDYSVRDWQRASQTMIMGKGFDTHAVFGPAIVTLDEIDDLSALELRTFVNRESRQVGYVRDQIHDIAAQIAHLTAAFTLEPGDVIFTGTPAGVGAGHTPPKWLKAGDRVRVEIDCLGFIENEIVREPGETVIS